MEEIEKNKNFESSKITTPLPKKPWESFVFFGVLCCVMIGVGVSIWIQPKATIILEPEISPLTVSQNVLVKLPKAEVTEAEKTLPQIPGITVETNVAGVENFPTSGRTYKVTNASGLITLFNETEKEKFLVPSRLLASGGVIVRMQKSVTIPPKSGDTPGQVSVRVVADEYDEKERPIGSRGNLEAGELLTFPALRNELQELYYGKVNQGPLVGGSTLTEYFLAEGDFEEAQNIWEEVFHTQALEQLQNEIAQRSTRDETYLLIKNPALYFKQVTDIQHDKIAIGTPVETFRLSGKMKFEGVVFAQEPILEILKEKLIKSQDRRQKLIEIDPLSFQFSLQDKKDFEEFRFLKISASAIGTQQFDISDNNQDVADIVTDLKNNILGSSPEQVRSLLSNRIEIKNVIKIDITPFWRKTLPLDPRKIKFELRETVR